MSYPLASSPDHSSLNLAVLLVVGEVPHLDPLGMGCRVDRWEDGPPGSGHAFDAAVVMAEAATPAFAAWLAEPGNADLPLIVLVDDASTEAAGALMGARILAFLDRNGPPEALAQALSRIRGHSASVADANAPFDQRIAELKREAERMAAAVAQLAAERGEASERPVDAARIRAHIRARRARERFFDPALFADPAWDIFLDLAAARLEGRLVSVSSLCIAAAVPTTTALRWIKNLVDAGFLLRTTDRNDARRAFVTLSPATSRTLDQCLAAVFNQPGL